MTTISWIGFGFLALLVLFLIASFFLGRKLSNAQTATLKFLTALCAGVAGAFLTGNALSEMKQTSGPTTYAISGSAGLALFMIVWFFYPRVFGLDEGFEFSIVEGWTFQEAARAMAKSAQGFVVLVGFTEPQLAASLEARQVSAGSLEEALGTLRLLSKTADAVPPYEVTVQSSIFRLEVKRTRSAITANALTRLGAPSPRLVTLELPNLGKPSRKIRSLQDLLLRNGTATSNDNVAKA